MNRYGCVFAGYDTLNCGDLIKTSDGGLVEILHAFSFCKFDEICECMILMSHGEVKFAQSKIVHENFINWDEFHHSNREVEE